jgi:zinc/manganese transport system permease protein
MSGYDLLFAPLVELEFMRRALLGTLILSTSACTIGVFLALRRMSLAGDAIGHAILPGVAIGFFTSGMSVLPMALGGVVAGLAVALIAGAVARLTIQKEDASLAAFYLVSLALGVLLISMKGSDEELMHMLFGAALAIDGATFALIVAAAFGTVLVLAIIWRGLVADSLDPVFLRTVSRAGPLVHLAFLTLVVINLVAGFAALGTLLSIGLMMLPALAARFWTGDLKTMVALAIAIGATCSAIGLMVSYHADVAPGPAIVLTAGAVYAFSLAFARHGLRVRIGPAWWSRAG